MCSTLDTPGAQAEKKLDQVEGVSGNLKNDKLYSRSHSDSAAQCAIEQGFMTEQQWEEMINEKIRQRRVVEQGGPGGDNGGAKSPTGRAALNAFSTEQEPTLTHLTLTTADEKTTDG